MRVVQGKAVLSILLMGVGLLVGCEAPVRVKPWRHAPDPTLVADAPRSPLVLSAQDREQSATPDAHTRPHTLRIAMNADPGRLFPLQGGAGPSMWAKRAMLGPVFESLVAYEPAADGITGQYAPRLARTWRVMPGGQEIRFELVPNAVFHDGHPVSTVDVQFTLDAIRDPKRGFDAWRAQLSDVEAIELITPTQIRLRLRRPSAWVLRALAEIPVLPMHVYKDTLTSPTELVGSGPWRLAGTKNGGVQLARFDKHWSGPAAIANIEFVYQPDAAQVMIAAKRNEIDIVPELIAAHWPEQATAPGIVAQFAPLRLAPPVFRFLAFGVTRPPLDSVAVRHALALLFDRRNIAKTIFDGLQRPALWPIWPGGPAVGPEPQVPAFDPAQAGALLDGAGWQDRDKDGVRDNGSEPLRVVMIGVERPGVDPNLPGNATERERFIEAARRVGVVIELKTGTEGAIGKRLLEGDFQLALVEWRGDADSDLRDLLGTAGRFNVGRFSDSRMDRLLADLAQLEDPAARAKTTPALVQLLETTWPLAGVVAEAPQGLVHHRVGGLVPWNGWFDVRRLRLAASK